MKVYTSGMEMRRMIGKMDASAVGRMNAMNVEYSSVFRFSWSFIEEN